MDGTDFGHSLRLEFAGGIGEERVPMPQPSLGKESLAGQMLGRYRIVQRIDEGGQGIVYRACDERLKRDVAIKVLPSGRLSDAAARQRLRKEALALSELNHPNIAVLFDFDSHDGVDYLVEEFIRGISLQEMLDAGPLKQEECIQLGEQLCAGLTAAHERGIIHRDIKPGNIRVTPEGRVKILDFGLAKAVSPTILPAHESSTLSETQAVVGTFPYMSPEQLTNKKLDARTDIWSAGAVLYEMASGRRAFPGSGATLMDQILHASPAPVSKTNREASAGLETIIQKCLEKDPELRYQSAREVAVDLKRLSQPSSSRHAVQPQRSIWLWLSLAAMLAVVSGVALFWWAQKAKALTDKDAIVLTDFVNSTGDPEFDNTLTQALAIQLEQSPFLNVLSDTRTNDALKLMERTPGDRITRDVGREICLRTGSKALVAGSIAKLGNSYAITLRATNCQTADSLASVEGEADTREHVLPSLGGAVTRLRGKLGESLASIQKFDKPLEEATTSSLEALQAYTTSRRVHSEQGPVPALPYAKRAVELDPSFALGYSNLASLYGAVGELPRERELAARAYELRARVNERERFYIEAEYFQITGEVDKEMEVYTQWMQAYPNDATPHLNLGYVFSDRQQFENAIPELREAQRLAPENASVYATLMVSYMRAERFEEADKMLQEGEAHKLTTPYFYYLGYYNAFLEQDPARMQQFYAWGQGRPSVEDWFLEGHAGIEAYYGHMRSASQLAKQARASALRSDRRNAAADDSRQYALIAAWTGNVAQAREFVSEGLRIAPIAEMALPLAVIGDSFESRKLIALGRSDPSTQGDPRIWQLDASLTEAILALQSGKARDALARLEGLPVPPVRFNTRVSFVRAEALLRLGQADAAAQEYSKILANRTLVLLNSEGFDAAHLFLIPLSHLGLGRARAQAGDLAGARQSYEQFFTIWKDADLDVPILQQAKAEYSKLK
jgi:eukaryotic-like serine/threonine-protein kinase